MKAVGFVLAVCLLGSCSRADIELAGGEFTNSSHWDGRWILINYWSEWCAPCRAEIPELNELHSC